MKRALLGLAAFFFAASLVLAWLLLRGDEVRALAPPPVVAAATIDALYATALPDVAGVSQTLAQWRGKVLVVNYWATWCEPCRDEMPEFSELQTRYAARGVQFVGIAADSAEKVVLFSRVMPLSYPMLAGGDDAIKPTAAFGNAPLAVPFTLVLDRAGKLRAAVLGRVDPQALERLLDELV